MTNVALSPSAIAIRIAARLSNPGNAGIQAPQGGGAEDTDDFGATRSRFVAPTF